MKTIFQRGTKLFDKFTMGHFFHLIVKRLNHFIKKAKSNIKKAKSLFDILLSDSGGYVSSVNAFLFSLKNKTISSRLKPLYMCIETVILHSIIILLSVQSLEVVMTYTSQTTQT